MYPTVPTAPCAVTSTAAESNDKQFSSGVVSSPLPSAMLQSNSVRKAKLVWTKTDVGPTETLYEILQTYLHEHAPLHVNVLLQIGPVFGKRWVHIFHSVLILLFACWHTYLLLTEHGLQLSTEWLSELLCAARLNADNPNVYRGFNAMQAVCSVAQCIIMQVARRALHGPELSKREQAQKTVASPESMDYLAKQINTTLSMAVFRTCVVTLIVFALPLILGISPKLCLQFAPQGVYWLFLTAYSFQCVRIVVVLCQHDVGALCTALDAIPHKATEAEPDSPDDDDSAGAWPGPDEAFWDRIKREYCLMDQRFENTWAPDCMGLTVTVDTGTYLLIAAVVALLGVTAPLSRIKVVASIISICIALGALVNLQPLAVITDVAVTKTTKRVSLRRLTFNYFGHEGMTREAHRAHSEFVQMLMASPTGIIIQPFGMISYPMIAGHMKLLVGVAPILLAYFSLAVGAEDDDVDFAC
eukprot:TRINITY_DN38622_c0_g1_i1.p1 TRINITY_DN38622_c0_g1~~TRINITY_DN38622_c0_g1_i1.p1  ORF type:complete len:471 (+),score=68.78 TRINITY_DN38622_c0_g1_i1:41-1453(+)